MRKFFSPLRSISTLVAVLSVFAFSTEIVSMPRHKVDHCVQAAKLQHSAGNSIPAFSADGCDSCHAYSLVSGFETFLPQLAIPLVSQPLEKLAVSQNLQSSSVLLPPVRGPPTRA